jgi:predicted dehydrogenase
VRSAAWICKPVGLAIAAVEHFDACVTNDTEPMVTDEDGLMAARVVSAIAESAKTRKPVELN